MANNIFTNQLNNRELMDAFGIQQDNAPLTPEELVALSEQQQAPAVEEPVEPTAPTITPPVVKAVPTTPKQELQQAPTALTEDLPKAPATETPMSKSEALMAEYNKLLGKGQEDLAEARRRDRMLKVGGSLGDALATYLNARSQMNVKAPGVQVQQGAGLGKVADMFATSPEIASDIAQRREAMIKQYAELAKGERSQDRLALEEKKAKSAQELSRELAKEKNQTMLKAAGIRSSGKDENRKFREDKFEYDKIVKLQDSFNKDKQVVKAEERIQSAATLRDMIDGNPITQEAAKTFAARASGEVGALSDQDRAAYGGSKAIIDRINSTFTRAVTGELTDTDKKFMKELADKFEAAGQRDLQARLSLYSKQGTKRTKMSEDEVRETIRPDLYIPQQEQSNTIQPETIIRFDPKSKRNVEYDATTKKPIRFVD
jgi:hypothetical protein